MRFDVRTVAQVTTLFKVIDFDDSGLIVKDEFDEVFGGNG